jgi:hypothetical protein
LANTAAKPVPSIGLHLEEELSFPQSELEFLLLPHAKITVITACQNLTSVANR